MDAARTGRSRDLLPRRESQQAIRSHWISATTRTEDWRRSLRTAPTYLSRTSSQAASSALGLTMTPFTIETRALFIVRSVALAPRAARRSPVTTVWSRRYPGSMSLTGDADGPATRAGIPVFDILAGLHGTIGILAALNHRTKTGEGQHIEVSLLVFRPVRAGKSQLRLHRGRRRPVQNGERHPKPVPLRTTSDKRPGFVCDRRVMMASSASCARSWISTSFRRTCVLRALRIATGTGRSSARFWSSG